MLSMDSLTNVFVFYILKSLFTIFNKYYYILYNLFLIAVRRSRPLETLILTNSNYRDTISANEYSCYGSEKDTDS
jgi:hypothetical protein